MADSAVFTAVINQVVEIVANLNVKTGSRLRRLKDDIEWIEGKMRHFNSCLKDAELKQDGKQDGSEEVANLIKDMRGLALDIEDILDTYLPEIASHKGKGPFGLVKHASCILCYCATANTFSLKIEEIKNRAQEIEVTRQNCQVNADRNEGKADMDVWVRREKFLVAPESIFVGRTDTLQELKEKFSSSNLDCKMICIVGVAGAGKTTVGKKIYKEMQNDFTCSALVYVSNEPRVQELLLEIAKQVRLEKEKMNENLEVNLRSLLNEKKCLIFLDDVWKTQAWDDLKNVIPIDSKNGSRIIVTSRYTYVGRHIGGESSLIELKLLDPKKSWELFSELMKSSSENTNERFLPLDLEDIAKKIVERCGGLPLAIVVAVGMLRQRRRDTLPWQMVLDILSTSAENDCSQILSLSYKDLPPDLKPFFLYFGLFPEDDLIYSRDLVRAWVSEKLIPVDGNRNPDDIVAVKLEMLSDRNLIQAYARDSDGRVDCCRIHDLLRVLCIKKAIENNFFFNTRRDIHSNSFSMLRRLTIDNTSQFSFSKTPKLRTLFCFSNSREGWSLIPDEIGDLSRLTFLELRGRFERMPSTIRNLKKLVTLDILRARFNCGLPTTIFRMKHLKYLILGYAKTFESNKCTNLNVRNEVYLPNVEDLFGMPGTILKASSVQYLSNLRELFLYEIDDQCINVISGKTPISEKLQALGLKFTQKFERLNLSRYDRLAQLTLGADSYFPFKLDIIEFPPNLIFLRLWRMKFTEGPMKVLKELRKLEFLQLGYCEYSQSIMMDFSGENSFPELRVLKIYGSCPELIVDQRGMPKLNKFVCNQKGINVPERLREIMVDPFR